LEGGGAAAAGWTGWETGEGAKRSLDDQNLHLTGAPQHVDADIIVVADEQEIDRPPARNGATKRSTRGCVKANSQPSTSAAFGARRAGSSTDIDGAAAAVT